MLPQTSLFKDLSEAEIEGLALSARLQTYRPEQVIIKEGPIRAAFFVIATGSAEVVKGIDGSEPVKLATLGKGEFFGEIATMKHETRSASGRALEETECLAIRSFQVRHRRTE